MCIFLKVNAGYSMALNYDNFNFLFYAHIQNSYKENLLLLKLGE